MTMNPSPKQTTISQVILIWASINLAYILFAIWLSSMNENPWTTGDVIATIIKLGIDIMQLVFAVMLVRHFRMWNYRLSIVLIPISVAIFWLLPF
jgi:hypothetical protein